MFLPFPPAIREYSRGRIEAGHRGNCHLNCPAPTRPREYLYIADTVKTLAFRCLWHDPSVISGLVGGESLERG